VLWALLEDAEGLLAAGRFDDADQRCWQALQHVARKGAENEPASFAAHFGRARALEGLNGTSAVVGRLSALAAETARSLGAEHPLARCVATYAEVRAGRER